MGAVVGGVAGEVAEQTAKQILGNVTTKGVAGLAVGGAGAATAAEVAKRKRDK